MSVKVTKDKLQDVLKSIHKLVSQDVLIGIPQSEDQRKEGPLNNATIGYIQETGSPANNLPARPFLVPGVEKSLERATKHLKRGGERAIDGEPGAAEAALNAVGLIAQSSVRATIVAMIPPPLAESTIDARKRRGRTGTTPLLDTGQLRNSVTYVIRKAK